MNGAAQFPEVIELDKSDAPRPDLLAHKYRPEAVDKVRCHSEQARRLKQWIVDFTSVSRINQRNNCIDDDDDDSFASDASGRLNPQVDKNCILLTGPPGVGKTSLVYTVAKELNMHVVESHPSEKRDFRLFSSLKLANQKGKINPVTKMFQAAQARQQQKVITAKRKRRKLDELQQAANNGPAAQASNQCLSLSGETSIVLFDDIDVVFEEDGPFLKSLVEFIRDSKRPVVLTATKSVDFIKTVLIEAEHIHLETPMIDDCTLVLKDICRREQLGKLAKVARCRSIATKLNCDIRQCLNRIHFYGDQAAHDVEDDDTDISKCIQPDLTRLSEFLSGGEIVDTDEANGDDSDGDSDKTDCNQAYESRRALSCYSSNSVIDLMDSTFNFLDRKTLLARWLDGKPSIRQEEFSSNHELGEQIKRSIVELTHDLCANEIMNQEDIQGQRRQADSSHQAALVMGDLMNSRIKGRIEPPEVEFYTDIVPMLGAAIRLEAERRSQYQQTAKSGGSLGATATATASPMNISRRTRRIQSYLETIGLYLEPEEYVLVCNTLLRPARLGKTEEEDEEDEEAAA